MEGRHRALLNAKEIDMMNNNAMLCEDTSVQVSALGAAYGIALAGTVSAESGFLNSRTGVTRASPGVHCLHDALGTRKAS